MALRIGLPGSSALKNDRHIKPVSLKSRTPQETNPKGHWDQIIFAKTIGFFLTEMWELRARGRYLCEVNAQNMRTWWNGYGSTLAAMTQTAKDP